jgi:predicted aspartyl protease
MWKPFRKTGTWILLSGILTLGSVACNGDTPDNPPSQQARQVPKPQALPSPAPQRRPKPIVSLPKQNPPPTSDTYAQAIDIASGAVSISQSAVCRDDWQLVAKHWQEAINLLKAVPASSPNQANVKQKLLVYQRYLTTAQQKAAPPPKPQPPLSPAANKAFFKAPIKRLRGGTPVIEVTFNGNQKFEMLLDTGASGTLLTPPMAYALGLKPVGVTNGTVADGATVQLPVAYVKSMEIDGRVMKKVLVAIAPASKEIGLLGQDFFEGYDITIKQDLIEFRRR